MNVPLSKCILLFLVPISWLLLDSIIRYFSNRRITFKCKKVNIETQQEYHEIAFIHLDGKMLAIEIGKQSTFVHIYSYTYIHKAQLPIS